MLLLYASIMFPWAGNKSAARLRGGVYCSICSQHMFFSFEADTCYEESSSAFQIRPAVQDFRDQESSRWKHVFFRLRMLDDAASSCTEQESKDACNVLQPCFLLC